MTDILFIHPGTGQNYQGVTAAAPAIAPPTWILLLADFCRRAGHGVAIHDANVQGWDEGSAEEVLKKFDPRLIVIWVAGHNPSASTQTMPIAGKIARDLKAVKPWVEIAMGGVHPSALPARTLADEAIDYVIKGEGFKAIAHLVGFMKKGGGIEVQELPFYLESAALRQMFHGGIERMEDLRGLYYRGSSRKWNSENQIAELGTSLKGYAWDLLEGGLDAYRAHDHHVFQDAARSKVAGFLDIRSPYATIYTSLGCPFDCNSCVTPGFFDSTRVRYWSPEIVVGWIDELVKRYGVRNIRIEDEIFILDAKRVEAICDLLIARGHDLNLWCYGRVDMVYPRILAKMKTAGFNWICLGIEAANQNALQGIGKPLWQDSEGVVRQIKAAGINVMGNFMFGLPGERLEDMEATLCLAQRLQCEAVNFYSCMPLPGSALYATAEKEGRLPPSWAAYSQLGYECQPMGTEYLTPAEALNFRDQAHQRYHQDAGYLRMIGEKWGSELANEIESRAERGINRVLGASF